jgi:hypothetical protein
MLWKKTTPFNGSGFCTLTHTNAFLSSLNSLSSTSSGSVLTFSTSQALDLSTEKKTCLQAPEQGLFYKLLQLTFVPKDIVTAQLSVIWE